MQRLILRSLCVTLTVTALALGALAGKDFVMPRASAARSYPAHDEHPLEKVAVAADPYDTPEKIKAFRTDFRKYGLLPVFVVVTNDGGAPVALTDIKVQLNTRDHAKADPFDNGDVLRRVTKTSKVAGESTGARRSPIPWPKSAKGVNNPEVLDEVSRAQFLGKAVEPHSSLAGFLFFDVSGLDDPLRGATLFVTGVKGSDGNELMYFEVDLTKYLEKKEPI